MLHGLTASSWNEVVTPGFYQRDVYPHFHNYLELLLPKRRDEPHWENGSCQRQFLETIISVCRPTPGMVSSNATTDFNWVAVFMDLLIEASNRLIQAIKLT